MTAYDGFLERLFEMFLVDEEEGSGKDGRFLSDITIVLNGAILCGRPITASRYFHLTGELFSGGNVGDVQPGDGDETSEEIRRTLRSFGNATRRNHETLMEIRDRIADELEPDAVPSEQQQSLLDSYRPKFLHLECATLFLGSIRVDDAGLWRVRLTDVSGWTLGSLIDSA